MTAPTVQQVHKDAILSDFSQRFMNEATAFVADRAFPILTVQKQTDLYFEYTAKYWFLDEMEERPPGATFPTTDYVLTTASYTCVEYALSHPIPDEVRANADSPLAPDQEAAELLATKALIHRERSFATAAMGASIWTTTNTSATDWDATTGAGTVPITNIQVAQRTILYATGYMPNTVVMGLIVHHGLLTNASIIDRIKHTSPALPRDLEEEGLLARALEVQNYLVSRATYDTTKEGVTSSLAAIIDDDALLMYVPPRPGLRTAAAGLTFVWPGGGGAGEVSRWRDDSIMSDIARFRDCFVHKKVSADLGYIWTDIV